MSTITAVDVVARYELAAIKPGMSDAAKEALLNCFEHVAWIDGHGQNYYDELYEALYGETPERWDYEWDASSEVLPEGMIAFRYNFTDEPGAMFVANPVLDFGYIGNCRMMIECKWSIFYENMDTLEIINYANGGNNPQLFALNKTIDNQNSGSRVIGHADNQSAEGCDLRFLAGQSQQYFGYKDNIYHLFDLLANGNECSVSLPNDDFSVSGTGFASQYNPYTGIKSAYPPYEDEDNRTRLIYVLYIKSIKFKKL